MLERLICQILKIALRYDAPFCTDKEVAMHGRESSQALSSPGSGAKVGEADGSMQETLLYGLGFVVGVGGVLGGASWRAEHGVDR